MLLYSSRVDSLKENIINYITIDNKIPFEITKDICFYGDCQGELQLCFLKRVEKQTFNDKIVIVYKGEELDFCPLSELPLETLAEIADYLHLLPANDLPF